jgi:hypothetical protein
MRRICAYEVFGTVIVIGILAALLVPSIHGGRCGHEVKCAQHLAQLYKLGILYAANHKGQWPEPGEGNYWHAFADTTPPYIGPEEREILRCPLREEDSERDCGYRGPKVPWSRLQPGDPLAAERPGNHGPGEPVNVLFKDGSVMEVELNDPRWKRWNELLGPRMFRVEKSASSATPRRRKANG